MTTKWHARVVCVVRVCVEHTWASLTGSFFGPTIIRSPLCGYVLRGELFETHPLGDGGGVSTVVLTQGDGALRLSRGPNCVGWLLVNLCY